MHERGNALGVSIRNVNDWVQETLNRPLKPQDEGISCLLKLYDENITKFRLNDCVTFVGILEFKSPDIQQKAKADDEIDQIESGTGGQTQNQPEMADDGFGQTIPNEDKLPKLHVISAKHFEFLKNQSIQNRLKIDLEKLSDQLQQEISKISEKDEDSVMNDFR